MGLRGGPLRREALAPQHLLTRGSSSSHFPDKFRTPQCPHPFCGPSGARLLPGPPLHPELFGLSPLICQFKAPQESQDLCWEWTSLHSLLQRDL